MRDGEAPNECFVRGSVPRSKPGTHVVIHTDNDVNQHFARNVTPDYSVQKSVLLAKEELSRKVLDDVVLSAYSEMDMAKVRGREKGKLHALLVADSGGQGNEGGRRAGRDGRGRGKLGEGRGGQQYQQHQHPQQQHQHQQYQQQQQQHQHPRQQQQNHHHQGSSRGGGGWRGGWYSQQRGARSRGRSGRGGGGRYAGGRTQTVWGSEASLPSSPPPPLVGKTVTQTRPTFPVHLIISPRYMQLALASGARIVTS